MSSGHATWSASASERLWNCPGSLALSRDAPPDRESFAAAWGTAAHAVAEECLRNDTDAIAHLGRVEAAKEHEIPVDDEMCEVAQEFIDYVRGRAEGCDLRVEQKFSLDALDPPFDAGGTGDAVILDKANECIEIVDLKTGRGHVVEVIGNKQLRTYALGAYLANPGRWRKVRATIVQPRAPHRDGRTRSEEFHVADLIEWTSDLMEAMGRAAENEGREKGDLDLNAGEHCTFCRAQPICPAIEARTLEVAQTFFEPQTGKLNAPPPPEELEMAQIVRILDHADMIQNWLNAVRAHAQYQAEMGVDVTDGTSSYVLTPKRAMRKWQLDEGELVGTLTERTGMEAGEFYQAKLMSPAQVEKALGKKEAKAVSDLWASESSGYNLTRADKTHREAVEAPAKKFITAQGKD